VLESLLYAEDGGQIMGRQFWSQGGKKWEKIALSK
jgi:hypothetical protein